jgi:hypothetical protein
VSSDANLPIANHALLTNDTANVVATDEKSVAHGRVGQGRAVYRRADRAGDAQTTWATPQAVRSLREVYGGAWSGCGAPSIATLPVSRSRSSKATLTTLKAINTSRSGPSA